MIHEADHRLRQTWGPRFDALPDDAKEALRAALMDLREDALKRAEYCWRKHKAPMALYWKVVGVYAGHLARVMHRSAASVKGADVETNYAALKEQLLNWAKVLRIDPMVTIHERAANLAFATEIEAMVGKLP